MTLNSIQSKPVNATRYYSNFMPSNAFLIAYNLTRIFTIDVVTEPEFRLSRPELRGDLEELSKQIAFGSYLPDGRSLLVMKGEEETTPDRVNVILNWTAELQRRMDR